MNDEQQLIYLKHQESIRRGHDDLGDHFLDCGDLANALKCYSRARDYCTSGRHVVNMCVNVIKVSVYLQNWSHVVSYVNKAMATPDFNEGNAKGILEKFSFLFTHKTEIDLQGVIISSCSPDLIVHMGWQSWLLENTKIQLSIFYQPILTTVEFLI